MTAPSTVIHDEAMDGRQLLRSRTNRRIAGVCGGIGEYFNIDPTLVRVAFVVATLIGLSGILVYILLWIVMPEAPPGVETEPGYSGGTWRASPAIRIAEDRFARGEITAQDLAQIREDLGGGT